MYIYTTVEIKDKKIWENYVLSSNPKSFLHSWNWGETNRLMGDKIFRLGFYRDNQLVGVCLAIKKEAKSGASLIIPGGPLINWERKRQVRTFLKEIKKIAKKEKVWFVRVRPEIKNSADARALFNNLKFLPAPMHLHAENTWVLNIQDDNKSLLSKMRKNTRYLIKKSEKLGLTIDVSTNPKDASILKKLQDETVKRHKFVGFSEKLFRSQLATFAKGKQAKLYLCKEKDQVLVAALIIYYGNYAYYHHSASSELAREIPASYFLQWRIIREARDNGFKYYNFWGIAPKGKKKHRFSGVTTFKKGFGGKRVNWLHAQDLPIDNRYILTFVFEKGRKIFRRL